MQTRHSGILSEAAVIYRDYKPGANPCQSCREPDYGSKVPAARDCSERSRSSRFCRSSSPRPLEQRRTNGGNSPRGRRAGQLLGPHRKHTLLRFPQHLTRLFRLSRSSRTGSCWDPPGSWVCDRSAADTVPSSDRGSVAGSAANRELADSPAAEPAVSTLTGLQDIGRETAFS
jgi:hypothetical protein